jgi:hypothetical protein
LKSRRIWGREDRGGWIGKRIAAWGSRHEDRGRRVGKRVGKRIAAWESRHEGWGMRIEAKRIEAGGSGREDHGRRITAGGFVAEDRTEGAKVKVEDNRANR